MAKICLKGRIYLGIGLSVWETAKIFGKWRRSVGNGSNMWGNDLIIWQNILKMWKMTYRFGKWPKYLGNDLDAWGTA